MGLDSIGRHDHLGVTACIKSIQLVEEFQHCPLNLSFSAAVAVVPFSANGINFVDEDNTGTVLIGHPEQLSHQLGTVSEVLLDQLTSHHSEEGCAGLVGNGLRRQGLASARGAVQDHPLGRLNPHLLVVLGVGEGQFHRFLDLLDLRVKTSNICITLSRGFLKLHDGDHWIGVIREHSNHSVHLVIEQDRATRLQLILVDEREDGDVVLGANTGRDDCVVVVDDLLKIANRHGCSSQVVDLASLLLVLLLLGLQPLLVPDELLLHQQVVLNPLLLQKPQTALGVGRDAGQLVGSVGSLHSLPLLANPGWHWRLILLLFLVLSFVLASSTSCSGLLISHCSSFSTLL